MTITIITGILKAFIVKENKRNMTKVEKSNASYFFLNLYLVYYYPDILETMFKFL